ncbi:uncharacterized protein LOC132200510 [Neocloeon triangulifer]|uniref:uncharacterized protein LOC132200510 n=1 Tax=Neocloeon triangulifer TaxID=2078957 RepID=UPI00286EE3F7|nr:uncharacterized protein LOC132200510 [Neocloeon triangulifer]
MGKKLIFGALIALATFSVILSASVGNPKVIPDGYVDIGGQQYYINVSQYFKKDEARAFCNSLNMDIVSFEEKNKWDTINTWAQEHQDELSKHWFWIGAERVNTTHWRWEVSKKPITRFYWIEPEPDLAAEVSETICLGFVSYSFASGWCDDICDDEFIAYSVLCQ